jgi:hypothetical protein
MGSLFIRFHTGTCLCFRDRREVTHVPRLTGFIGALAISYLLRYFWQWR